MSGHEPDPSPGAAGGVGLRASTSNAMPMRVLALHPEGEPLARCAGIDGVPRTVRSTLVGPLEPGAIVLVHGSVALLRLDAEWAT